MLDFSRLRAPDQHGEVLVEPHISGWVKAARENNHSLSRADTSILGMPLAHWRRRTREAVVGRDDALVFVLGHQPELFHPGVWAKRVVAARIASATQGVALNLVVDNDAPQHVGLAVPTLGEGNVALNHVAIPQLLAGRPYEYTSRMLSASVSGFEDAVARFMGERFATSQMPPFIQGVIESGGACDWVDQILGGTDALDARHGFSVLERRVSRLDTSPLLADMLSRAFRFAESYNTALATYRRTHRVRGDQRPIPDLHVLADWCEVPVWATRSDEPRRRLFVRRDGSSLVLRADQTVIAELPAEALKGGTDGVGLLGELDGWHLRPRALALTMWARLLLGDLFIHGIGGAKYDRISDTIVADYYGVTPPHMVCVSATLHLDLPYRDATASTVRARRLAVRDLTFNPQRNLDLGSDETPLLHQRLAAIRETESLRRSVPPDRRARRVAFNKIRRINQALLDAHAGTVERKRAALSETIGHYRQGRIARDREYFFGLHDNKALDALLAALPSQRGFRV